MTTGLQGPYEEMEHARPFARVIIAARQGSRLGRDPAGASALTSPLTVTCQRGRRTRSEKPNEEQGSRTAKNSGKWVDSTTVFIDV